MRWNRCEDPSTPYENRRFSSIAQDDRLFVRCYLFLDQLLENGQASFDQVVADAVADAEIFGASEIKQEESGKSIWAGAKVQGPGSENQ